MKSARAGERSFAFVRSVVNEEFPISAALAAENAWKFFPFNSKLIIISVNIDIAIKYNAVF